MSKLYDVVVAGAGPVGLYLSCELALAGATVLVLERDPDPSSPWKQLPLGVRGINPRSVEAFYRRGLLQKVEEGAPAGGRTPFLGHFGGIIFDQKNFDPSRFPYSLDGPTLSLRTISLERFDSVLTERAKELGVEIRRGRAVTGILSQDATSVTVEASVQGTDGGEAGKEQFRGRWLVGCDGGRSAVRKLAGFEFPGTEPKFTVYSIQGHFANSDRLTQGFVPTDEGLYVLPPPTGWGQIGLERGDGKVIHLMDMDGGAFDRTHTPPQEHLQDVLRRVTGRDDVEITHLTRARTFTDRTRQTTEYRRGRIFLAGDASHIHPPLGGQGLNLGLEDAINLGWKLGAAVRKEKEGNTQGGGVVPEEAAAAADALLDTYEIERKPFATKVMEYTRAQVVALIPDEHGRATRAMLEALIGTPDGVALLVGRSWGIANRYPLNTTAGEFDHPVIGRSVPDFLLADGTRLGPLMHKAKGLLIDLQQEEGTGEKLKALLLPESYAERVEYLALKAEHTCGLAALLVRPDGIVAWAVEKGSEPNFVAAKAALKRWFSF